LLKVFFHCFWIRRFFPDGKVRPCFGDELFASTLWCSSDTHGAPTFPSKKKKVATHGMERLGKRGNIAAHKLLFAGYAERKKGGEGVLTPLVSLFWVFREMW